MLIYPLGLASLSVLVEVIRLFKLVLGFKNRNLIHVLFASEI